MISPVPSQLYPDPDAIPGPAMEPKQAINVTDGCGFIISWNVPDVNPTFIAEYEVIISRADSRRRKRQADSILVAPDQTSFIFITDQPYTDFLVRVDALLSVSGEIGRVPALVETRLRTSTCGGGESCM